MNTDMNKEVAQTQDENNPAKASKRKKRKPLQKKARKPSVCYSQEELREVEGEPFWNCVHEGSITAIGDDGITVSIAKDGSTLDVFVPNEDLYSSSNRTVGQPITIYLEDGIGQETAERPFLGSEIKAIELDLLQKAEHAQAHNEAVEGYVIGEIKGGYSVALFAQTREQADSGFGLRAFLPKGRTSLRRGEGLHDNEDHNVRVQISELDPVRGNIVVSRREFLEEERKKGEQEFFEAHKEGDVVHGTVTAAMPYGVFVSLGVVDGFLHISDVSWGKKPRLKDLVPVGKEITAKIISIDAEKKKIKLSLKDLNPDPWQNIEKNFKPGSEVQGTIVAFADFGAFVSLDNGVEGLIHVGEITWNRIKHPSQHFKIGDRVTALVLRVDKEARRISLSTKALEQSPVERLSSQFPIGSVIKTKIASIHEFGLFVELDEHSNGLVPRTEVSWVRNDEPLENRYSAGQEIEVAVLGYDAKRQRVSCSIKRLTDDPWEQWKQKFHKGSIHKVKVVAVKKAGYICELDGPLTGFCPRSQVVEGETEHGRSNIKVGQEIEVAVTACDLSRQRISLSQRQAAETETKKAYQSYLSEQGKGAGRTTLGDAFGNVNKIKERLKDHG